MLPNGRGGEGSVFWAHGLQNLGSRVQRPWTFGFDLLSRMLRCLSPSRGVWLRFYGAPAEGSRPPPTPPFLSIVGSHVKLLLLSILNGIIRGIFCYSY